MHCAQSRTSVKRQKVQELGRTCEECLSSIALLKDLVLHHIRNRCDGGSNKYENQRLRCKGCEVMYHALFHDGNRPPELSHNEALVLWEVYPTAEAEPTPEPIKTALGQWVSDEMCRDLPVSVKPRKRQLPASERGREYVRQPVKMAATQRGRR